MQRPRTLLEYLPQLLSAAQAITMGSSHKYLDTPRRHRYFHVKSLLSW